MNPNPPHTPSVQGREKRAFRRYPVQLPAQVALHGAATACEIRDFCIGGLFIALPPGATVALSPGEMIEVRCPLPGDDHRRTLQFTARIARADTLSIGVAFVDPDLLSLQQLQDYAVRRPTPPAHETPTPGTGAPDRRRFRGILEACSQLIRDTFEPLADEFLKHAGDTLFEAAESSKNTQEQNSYFHAMAVLSRSAGEVRAGFTASAGAQLSEFLEHGPRRHQSEPEQPPPGTLTLMADDVFEDWLIVTDTANHLESRFSEALGELDQRLGHLCERPITKENNPYGPWLYANAAQQAIKRITLDTLAIKLCYQAFKEVLASSLGDIYENLNRMLIEQQVLPELKPRIQRARENTPAASATPSDPPAAEAMPGPPSPPDGEGVTAYSERTPASPTTRASGGIGSGDVATAGGTVLHGEWTPHQRVQQDLYQLVNDLRTLQQRVTASSTGYLPGRAGPGPLPPAQGQEIDDHASQAYPSGGVPPATGPVETFSPHELFEVLDTIQQDVIGDPAGGLPHHDFRSHIMSTLAGERGRDPHKTIGRREESIMEVAGNIFESMLQDMLVAKSVRGWMRRLEIPLLKLAILDDSLFLDKNHVGRQVVNKLAELQLYGSGSGAPNAITRKINSLLEDIARNTDIRPETFEKALKELNLLTRIQDEAYQENLKEVVAECEAAEQHSGDDPATDADRIAAYERVISQLPCRDQELDPREWKEWLRRVRRIQPGSWVAFKEGEQEQKRLRLAWVSRYFERYVFVNLLGIKALTLDHTELASQMAGGDAVVLENADEPAMDRAQYTMLQRLHHQLVHETTHDPVTSLLNRREFERLVKKAQESAVRDNRTHSLCHLDINQFHVINSTCGYETGDRLLNELAQILQTHLDGDGVLARIGSDEFGMLLYNHGETEATELLRRQIESLNEYRLAHGEKRLSVSLAVGLVTITPESTNTGHLWQAAESSCSISKEKGNNHIQCYRSDDAELSQQHKIMRWVSRIDEALDKGYLDLRCQRIVPVTPDEDTHQHVEILLGVTNEEGLPISPEEFILAAEHYNRMAAVDRWVIDTVFTWMRENPEKVRQLGGLSINLSGRSINDESFLGYILDALRTYGTPTEYLTFEVTETAGIANLSNAVEFIQELKKTGCSFSLDDFGSGLSSYAYLKTLPVDFLKIDGAFVKNMHNNPNDFAVVKSISEIGHFMGKRIIAEYVENDEILAMLSDIGVDYAQGYGIERPVRLFDL